MNHTSTILIVDDQLSVREVLRGLLTGQNYDLAFAVNGREALTKAAKLTPDVILLDVMMPDMDGFEVCQRLRTTPLLAEVPIIMITALDDQRSLLRGIEAGADDFLTKPINASELLLRVKNTTRLNRYRRLLAGRAKFEWAVEQATDGYLVLDDNDNISYANAQARLYLDITNDSDEPILMTFLDLAAQQYHFETEAAWTTWPKALPPAAQLVRYLVQAETPTAHPFWLQVSLLELPPSSDGSRLVHLHDVTAQMVLERDMWEFHALVSHKLSTPLGGVYGGLDMLKHNGITELLDAGMVELFEMVFDSAQRLEHDIRNIVQHVNTPTLAQPNVNIALLQFQPLVTRISANLKLQRVTVTHQTKPDTARLPLTEQSLELILQEILGNSQKFHPQQNPDIEIFTFIEETNNQITIQIKDNGLTLSPEQLARVWTPYYQAEKYFTGEITGMGLGLPNVAKLMWSVGGSCRIYNRKSGPGVVVELRLPGEGVA